MPDLVHDSVLLSILGLFLGNSINDYAGFVSYKNDVVRKPVSKYLILE